MSATRALGIDLGGTKILAAVVDVEDGTVLGRAKRRTRSDRGAEALVERTVECAREALEEAGASADDLAGACAAVAGQIDRGAGIVRGAPNLASDLLDLPLADRLAADLGVRVTLANDVEAGAVGEATHGAGVDRDFVAIFVGTGVGGALVEGGRPRSGRSGTAGEVGHMVVQYGGRVCGCGGRGHLEAYASRTAITRVLLAELDRGRESVLREVVEAHEGEGPPLRSRQLAEAVEAGDELTTEVIGEAADLLGSAIASIADLLNPERFVLGGGLVDRLDFIVERAGRRAQLDVLPAARGSFDVVRAALGDDAGVVGAAVLGAATR
jgi:glucokinase